MTSMRERLKLVGGELLIESQPTRWHHRSGPRAGSAKLVRRDNIADPPSHSPISNVTKLSLWYFVRRESPLLGLISP